jgi:hypothetical protein
MQVAGATADVVALLLGVAAAALAVRTRAIRVSTAEQLELAVSTLRRASLRYVRREMYRRRLTASGLVQLRWTVETEGRGPALIRQTAHSLGVAVENQNIMRLHLSGTTSELIRWYIREPIHRLMIVGGAGSGKTSVALMLAEGMLADKGYAGPVPILLSFSSWDAERHSLQEWVAQRIAVDYPELGNRLAYGDDAVDRLLEDGDVLLLLDGLDELPDARRPVAMEAVADLPAPAPVVVTCRSTQFDRVLGRKRPVPTVKLAPIEPRAALKHLSDQDDQWAAYVDRHGWEHCIQRVGRHLTNPLLIFLASVAYGVHADDPEEFSIDQFENKGQVDSLLLGRFVVAVYQRHAGLLGSQPTTRLTTEEASAKHWNPDKAEEWLRFLAAGPGRDNNDIAWWALFPTPFPATPVFPVLGLVSVTAAGAVNGFVGGGSGLLLGTSFGLSTAFFLSTIVTPTNAWVGDQIKRYLVLDSGYGISMLLAALAAAGVARLSGVLMAIWVALLIFSLSYTMVRAAGDRLFRREQLADPVRVKRRMRTASLAGGVSFGLAGAVAVNVFTPSLADIAPLIGVACAFVAIRVTVWGAYVDSWITLATLRKIPWRHLRFLHDAARLGVLRQTGPVYQFRHERLQATLDSNPPGWPWNRPPRPPVSSTPRPRADS